MMREFAERQDRFMRNTMETGPIGDEEEVAEPSGPNIRREYDCVHCHQTQPSTQDQPMGLVVLLQATSVLGHKHKANAGLVLPVREEERDALAVDDSLAAEYESRFEELSRHFDTRSHLLAVNTGWQVIKCYPFKPCLNLFQSGWRVCAVLWPPRSLGLSPELHAGSQTQQ